MKYAVPVEIRLVFAKKDDKNFQVLSEAAAGIEGVIPFLYWNCVNNPRP
jgi:hypothetical protein